MILKPAFSGITVFPPGNPCSFLRVGVILAFFSNEKSFDSLENFQSALLVAADDAIEYTENGLEVGILFIWAYLKISAY